MDAPANETEPVSLLGQRPFSKSTDPAYARTRKHHFVVASGGADPPPAQSAAFHSLAAVQQIMAQESMLPKDTCGCAPRSFERGTSRLKSWCT